jgi:hypothetical protein
MAGELLDFTGMPKLEPTIEESTQAVKAYKTGDLSLMPSVFWTDISARLDFEKRMVLIGMTSPLPLIRFTTGALSGEALLGGLARGSVLGATIGTLAGIDNRSARSEIALAEYGWKMGRRDLLPDILWSNETAYAKFEQRMGYPFGKPVQAVAPTHPVSTPLDVALGRSSMVSPPVSMQQTQPTRVSSNGTVAPVDTPRVLAAEAPRTEVPQAAPTDFVTPVHRYEPVSSGYAELPTYGVDITSERVFFTEINNRLTALTLVPEFMRGDAWEAGVVELLKALEAVGFRKKVTTGATPPDPDDERRKKIGELLLLSAELIVDPKMRETAGKLAEELAIEAGLNREQAKKLRVLVEVLVSGVGTRAPKDPKAPKPEWKSPKKLAESKAVQRYVTAVERVQNNPFMIKQYLDHMEKITSLKLHPAQIKLLKDVLREKAFVKLDKAGQGAHRHEFRSRVKGLMSEWEANTGQKWPVYDRDYYPEGRTTGRPTRALGEPYDAHHIIQNSHGGPNEWWNIHPAHFKDEHSKIHGSGAPARKIFSEVTPVAPKQGE